MAAINKSFVIKNGLEVDTNLIFADSQTNKVGIGTTAPQYLLHVNGGIGVTDLYVSGIATITTGIVTNLTSTNLNVTGIGTIVTGNITNLTNTNLNVTGIATIATLNATGIGVTNFTVYNNLSVGGISTFTNGPVLIGSGTSTGTASQTLQVTGGTYVSGNLGIGSTNPTSALFIVGDARVTGVITATTFSGNVNAGVGTITTLSSTNGTITNLNVTGISTLGTVKISSGIVTATSGVVTYFGDGNFLNLTSNPSRGIGIGTTGGVVGYAVTFINFKGSGVSTAQYNSNTGIATIFFEGGGGGGGSISISTTAPVSPGSGDLWYSPDYGRTFIYYDESVVGYGTDAFWVDAAPFNVGIITSLTNVSFSPGSAVAPSMFFIGDNQTGFFSPGTGQFTVVSSGSSVLNVNASGINITGIATITNASGTVKIGIGTTALLVEGNARVTGILTVGSSSITLNGTTNIINVGTGLTLSSSGIVAGVITATAFVGDGSGLTGAGIGSAGNVNTSGIITASTVSANEFVGSGDRLIFSPVPTSFSPIDGEIGVSALNSPNISITYNQGIILGVGTITLRKDSAVGTIAESYTVGVSTRATVSGQTLTIDPTDNFDYAQEYYVAIPQGGVTNYNSNTPGLALTTYNFTTEAAPTLSSVSPGIGSTNVVTDTNIVFTFNKTIRIGVGTITLRTVSAGGTIVESYDVTSSNRLTFGSSTLTIDPTSNLGVGITHFVVVPNNAVAGYTGISTYSFTSIFQAFSSINPANGATAVGVDTNITLTFLATPVRGTGTIALRSGSTSGSVIETFDAASSGRISISGNNYIIDPTSNLGFTTSIHTIIPSTAIQNYVGLNTTGADTHSFTTAQPVLGTSYEGGFLICKAAPLRWVVSPLSAEVSRDWFNRNDANTTAQAVSGCTGWFIPTCAQLQNPGYCCRSFWGPSPCYSLTSYWTSYEPGPRGRYVCFTTGDVFGQYNGFQSYTKCVRAFRCVTY